MLSRQLDEQLAKWHEILKYRCPGLRRCVKTRMFRQGFCNIRRRRLSFAETPEEHRKKPHASKKDDPCTVREVGVETFCSRLRQG